MVSPASSPADHRARRIVIVNRGDAALRFIRAAREYELQHDCTLTTIALHVEEESSATFVREADEAVSLGSAMVVDDTGARQLSYVNAQSLTDALLQAAADLAWVGWGFVSEHPEFVDLCADLGVQVIGPRSDVMRALGDKVGAKLLAESSDVPVVPWSGGAIVDLDHARRAASHIGFPLLVKPSGGGGGRGIRRVESPDGLDAALGASRRESLAAFGDDAVFLEKAVTKARHIEVQVAADDHGTVWTLGVRDCSVQRRRQKIIEESGVHGVDPSVLAEVRAAAVRLVSAAKYTGLGTVEFLLDVDSGQFSFMEVNTRLQVEHTVTEEVSGVDLVKLQLDLAFGRELTGEPPVGVGYAVEARVTAEDASDHFRPAPGAIAVWQPAVGPGVRTDTGISAGDPTPLEFDPLLVKIIARGRDRDEAIARLRRAVAETRLVVDGGSSTLGFLRTLLAQEAIHVGGALTDWVDAWVESGAPLTDDRPDVALVLAAVTVAERQWAARADHLFRTAADGRPEVLDVGPYEIDLTWRGVGQSFGVRRLETDRYEVTTAHGPVAVETVHRTPSERVFRVGTREVVALLLSSADHTEVTVDGNTYRVEHSAGGVVTSPLPAIVLQVRVSVGQHVAAGETLAVLESMKLETPLVASRAGVVREIMTAAHAQVGSGDALMRIEDTGDAEDSHAGADVDFSGLVCGEQRVDVLVAVRRQLLGFDGLTGDALAGLRAGTRSSDEPSFEVEREVLELFAGCCAVTGDKRYRLAVGGSEIRGRDAAARMLAMPERSVDILPPEYVADVSALLRHFGVDTIGDDATTRQALHRVMRAGVSLGDVEPAIVGIMRRWIDTGPAVSSHPELRRVVERLAVDCETDFPVVSDLAWTALRHPGDDEPHVAPQIGPETRARLEFWRFEHFHVEHVATQHDVHLLEITAKDNDEDRRLVAIAGVTSAGESDDSEAALLEVETTLLEALALIRQRRASVPLRERTLLNRIVVYVERPWTVPTDDLRRLSRRLAPIARNLGIEKVVARIRVTGAEGELIDRVLHLTAPAETGLMLGETGVSDAPLRPMSPRQRRLRKLHRRGLSDPYEITDLMTAPSASLSDFPPGTFTEHDLDDRGRLVEVRREPGTNIAAVVVGTISNRTEKHPEGMERVIVLGDPGKGLGALAEPECRRLCAAIDLASDRGVPLEWFAISSGARISMSSGTENLDWTARVLRRIVEFTQAGGEVNVVLAGINVGAQSYFNAEATMLMHTRGVLIMTPGSSMVLTGKEALDFAGGISAENNLGIGGYDRVMGPNGQAQYWARTLPEACETLFRHYEHTYVAPGEKGPRPRRSSDPVARDIGDSPHPAIDGVDFARIGDIFSDEHNPARNRPFDIRAVMHALVDQDRPPQERWQGMAGAEGAVVWDAHLGGLPASVIGVESRPVARTGRLPADGPSFWSAATLFPASSKKVARALNSASGNRPVVVLANLAGFDGSPESLRELQLEHGAEIGRAVTNFDGPIVLCVLSRYHGGAFVVFSKALNDAMEVIALEGSRASVIGGAAAAAVVLTREVDQRVAAHPGLDDPHESVLTRVRGEVRKQLADEFDAVHSVERAMRVGSVDRVVRSSALRGEVIATLRRKVLG